jgi:membrane protein DedA with SNARE-associated domain
VSDWILRAVIEWGYWGVFLLMLLEHLFPPIPSELIMPFAGFAAAKGRLHLSGVIAAGTFGSLAGVLPWYIAGRWLGLRRLRRVVDSHGRWLTVSRAELDAAFLWFDRHGPCAVFIGRLVHTVRTLISVPAGLARMPAGTFLIATSAGSMAWTTALAWAGYELAANYDLVGQYTEPATRFLLGALAAFYCYRLLKRQPSSNAE